MPAKLCFRENETPLGGFLFKKKKPAFWLIGLG